MAGGAAARAVREPRSVGLTGAIRRVMAQQPAHQHRQEQQQDRQRGERDDGGMREQGMDESGRVAQRQPEIRDVDERLLVPAPRMVLNAVAAEHDTSAGGVCPACGWPIAGGQRACPSRVLARCVRDRRPVPAWLVGLVEAVPGARARQVREPVSLQQAMQDAMPGLFDAPARVEPSRDQDPTGGQR